MSLDLKPFKKEDTLTGKNLLPEATHSFNLVLFPSHWGLPVKFMVAFNEKGSK